MLPRFGSQCFSGVFHATSKEIFGVVIHKVDVAAFHAASQKNAISVFYHLRKSVTGPLHHGVVGLGLVPLPICLIRQVDQVPARKMTPT